MRRYLARLRPVLSPRRADTITAVALGQHELGASSGQGVARMRNKTREDCQSKAPSEKKSQACPSRDLLSQVAMEHLRAAVLP